MVRKKKHKYNPEDPIVIDNNEVKVGESKSFRIIVGRTPSDSQITIMTHVFRSAKPGPTLLVLGGVHGNEINGIEMVNQLILEDYFDHIERGSAIAIPLLNVFGFNHFSRDVPDGKDVNRSFPGSSGGSLASRVAGTLTHKVLPFVNYAIDCHTGGSTRYNYPQIRITKNIPENMKLAKVFAAPYTIESTTIPKSFRKVAKDLEIPTLVFEGGESIRLCGFSIHKGKEGIKRVMEHLGLKAKEEFSEPPVTTIIQKSRWIRASQAGIFIWSKSSGHFVTKGEPIGIIKNPYGTKHITVFSKYDGHIIGHNNASVVNQGDALFHIGLINQVYEGF
jgi:predicted deacylase